MPLYAVLLWAATLSAETPRQPLPYSHKTHLAQGLKCKDCHPNPEPGGKMTLPAVSTCLSCHTTIAKDKPAIRELARFAKEKQPVPWVRVFSVKAGTFWSHRSHLREGIACQKCHGDVPQMDVMADVTNVTTMPVCVSCHKETNANTGCDYCHEGK